jgi:hypothetical protein
LTGLIVVGVEIVLAVPVLIILFSGDLDFGAGTLVVTSVLSGVATILTTPLFNLVEILLYADARLRKEEPDPERLWEPVAASA